ncbi:hypothetical protein P691DRAFT_764605 [Macrolepiota fuliginosa MF-IS2]|uniref:4a-hydroxytetrahydrobiopterin dehydratase n=1 Tax=Macrolepiota fuliginosa MF-IS2 TaxID=1400762 RepID=A0A9P6BZ20_9AGAR|nr:hypothetical protein P691DRAFT_764605 [Macrolepiota fuliginosa MF-IS2]
MHSVRPQISTLPLQRPYSTASNAVFNCFDSVSLTFLQTPNDQQKGPVTSKTLDEPPLPGLPPPVKGWPSFWTIRKEVEDYLYPLYARGWGIDFLPRKYHSSPNDRYVAHLATEYIFANFNCASQFIADLSALAKEEKHHPCRFSLQNDKRPTLSLHVLTDSALRPRWNEEDPDLDPPLSRRVPGITRRDLRFAILLEQLYDQYYKDGRALEPRGQKLKHIYHRPTWEYLVSRFVRSSLALVPSPSSLSEREKLLELFSELEATPPVESSSDATNEPIARVATPEKESPEEPKVNKCQACGGPHRIHECTVRSHHPPSTLCYVCLEPHWWLDCPQRKR